MKVMEWPCMCRQSIPGCFSPPKQPEYEATTKVTINHSGEIIASQIGYTMDSVS